MKTVSLCYRLIDKISFHLTYIDPPLTGYDKSNMVIVLNQM